MLNKYLLFISPHLDDVVFSLSDYISNMIAKNHLIIIATVFTKSNLSILENLTGDYYLYGDYKTRVLEDKNAIKSINKNIIIEHLDFPEEIFRKHYNTIYTPLIIKINFIIKKYNVEKIYFPLAIGNHTDHKIVYNVSQFYKNKFNTYYYFDYPYCAIDLNTKFYLSTLGNFQKIYFIDICNFMNHPIYNSTPKLFLFLKMVFNIFLYLIHYVYYLFFKSKNFNVNTIKINDENRFLIIVNCKK